jgi:hypothetical protein
MFKRMDIIWRALFLGAIIWVALMDLLVWRPD